MTQPQTLDCMDDLIRSSRLGKHRHFIVAKRSSRNNIYLGVLVVSINVFLGSILFYSLTAELPVVTKWAGAILALAATLFAGYQSFFNFGRLAEGHAHIGNRYLAVAREGERLKSLFLDGLLDLEKFSKELKSLAALYDGINNDALVLATKERDFQRALAFEEERESRTGSPSGDTDDTRSPQSPDSSPL